MANKFSCDIKRKAQPLIHFWEHTIGSGHATLGLRADWQQQLLRCHKELGFKHVRFHGILSDDMGTLLCENDKLLYSFFNADHICDFLLSIGMRPFMELSFMPMAISSGSETVFSYRGNITPPHDYKDWETLIKKLITHWADRYGIKELKKWFFEIWNEPNLSAFWKGSQEDYFNLYQHACNAIKEVDDALKVGGPATAANNWITDFRNFCNKNKVRYDFISTHHYPTDAFGKPGDDTVAQLAASHRSVLQKQVKQTRKEAGDIPVYYTEWSTSSNPFDTLHDRPYAAAFIVKTIMENRGLVQGYSYWTFSDIFEENFFSSDAFHGGFGLMNIYGIPKPAYRAYQLLHGLGEEICKVEGNHKTVDVWVIKKENDIQVLITNSALPKHPVKEEKITIKLSAEPDISEVYVERIDEHNANAHAKWIEMGSPKSLHPKQVERLEQASSLVMETLAFTHKNGVILLNISISPQGTALITIKTHERSKK